MTPPRPDPIAFELFKNALFSIADEMALTIFRTAYSGVLKDVMDYSTAFCDGAGRTVAQGLTQPAHLFAFPEALQATLERYGDRMRPGDVYCLNDPYEGGMHLPDVFILKPIFHQGERLAFAGTLCHQTDVGGRVPGSRAACRAARPTRRARRSRCLRLTQTGRSSRAGRPPTRSPCPRRG